MNIKIDKKERYSIIQVQESKLDTSVALALKSEMVVMTGRGEKNILLDVSQCTSCNSAGLNAIQVASRLCKNQNGILVLGGVHTEVEHLIDISQADNLLNIAYKIEKADTMMNTLLDKNQ